VSSCVDKISNLLVETNIVPRYTGFVIISFGMASPVATTAGKPTYVGLNVRQVFETSSVEDVKDISKKVNHEIDRKREELRMLVGY